MEFRTYRNADWNAVRAFLHAHWRADHPYTDPTLFHWQYAGFGNGGQPVSKLIVRGDEILGFLGGIPGQYRVAGRVHRGVVFDLWVVRPDYRNCALGLLLMKALEDEFDVCCCLGVNRDVVHYYTSRGYEHNPSLHRYVAPLDTDACERLIAEGARHRDDSPAAEASDVRERLSVLRQRAREGTATPVAPTDQADPLALAALYDRTVARILRFGLERTAEFWEWRYLHSAGFRYRFFGDPDGQGVVIARVERIISSEQENGFDGRPVLRLIELLPARSETWHGAPDPHFAGLLRGVLRWGVAQGCILADYQLSSDRLTPLLSDCGFAGPSDEMLAGANNVPTLFQPLRYDMPPINLVWRLRGAADVGVRFGARDMYFAKSDNGMDRPNVWPLPPGYA